MKRPQHHQHQHPRLPPHGTPRETTESTPCPAAAPAVSCPKAPHHTVSRRARSCGAARRPTPRESPCSGRPRRCCFACPSWPLTPTPRPARSSPLLRHAHHRAKPAETPVAAHPLGPTVRTREGHQGQPTGAARKAPRPPRPLRRLPALRWLISP